MSEHTAENDAPGITYIDAPLPATVLALAYRMHAKWVRLTRGAAVSEYPAEFDVPVNVRVVDADGVEHPVDCAYVDTTPQGMRRWYVLAPQGSWRGLRADMLPARCELIFPWDTSVIPRGEEQP